MLAAESGTRGHMRKGMPFLIIFFLVAVSFAAGPKDPTPSPKDKCPVCGMFVSMYADWNARIEFKDITQAFFDGAKCMFKYYLNIKKYNPPKDKKDVTVISVKDYYSKTSIDALQAFFVIWSDVYGPMGRELIPFEKEGDAKEFMKDHKGKSLLSFKEVTSDLIKQLD